MKRYEKAVLEELIAKYESSLVYTGENKRNQRITCSITEKKFPEYFDLSSLAYHQLHEELMELEEKGFVSLVWKSKSKGHVLKEAELNQLRADEIYQILNRPSRNQVEALAFREIAAFESVEDNVTENAAKWLKERILEGKSVKKYVDISKPEQIRQILYALHAAASNKREMYLREFSILHFHDSKALENLEGKVLSLIREFYMGMESGLEDLDDEQLLNLFGIYKNPSYVMAKGSGTLTLCSDGERDEFTVNLSRLSGGIGIHSGDLMKIEFLPDSQVRRVLTIENLTVFHRFYMEDTLLIYLGGYHTKVRREFLKKVHLAFPKIEYLHFGDMDCGGFKILEDLRKKTGIAFLPYRMDVNTFLEFETFCRPLSLFDKKELARMLADRRYEAYWEVLQMMLDKGKKLEQECIGIPVSI